VKDDLAKLRINIDSLDEQIIDLIQKRASLASEIGQIKRQRGEEIYRPDRERDVLEKVARISQGPLSPNTIQAIYREIMSGTISLEHPVKVGYLGPEGSFSHEAVQNKFGLSIQGIPLGSIPEVFRSVQAGKIEYGLVPVENSTEGPVSATQDMLLDTDVKIYAETYRKISFCALGWDPNLKYAKRLYGIRIGNEQCRNWMNANLPNVEVIETSSTAMAAMRVKEDKEGVAIASSLAASLYGLQILREGIEDISGNATRFLILSMSECSSTGKDKTSIVLSITNQPGSLFEVLKVFYEGSFDLTKIESRPLKKNRWEYHFYLDVLGHNKDTKLNEAIQILKSKTRFFKVLGSYPVALEAQ